MRELGLAVSSEGVVIGLGGESERVEESDGLEGTDQSVDECSGRHRGGLLLGEGREGGGRSGGGDEEGGGEFHFDYRLVEECLSFVLQFEQL